MATETLFCLMRVWPKDCGRNAEQVLNCDTLEPLMFESGEAAQAHADDLNHDLLYWLQLSNEREAQSKRHAQAGNTADAQSYAASAAVTRNRAAKEERANGKVQPRPFATDANWRERERQRFSEGSYQTLPWADDSWWKGALAKRPSLVEHFAHVAKDAPGMLSYTESAQKGASDRQTRARPGRYLSAYFADALSADEIRAHAARYAAIFEGLELRFSDATSIERVYRRGPDSCMSKPPGSYQTPYHPTRVYGDSDLSVAFIGQGTVSSSEFHVTARALVWRERKLYGRIYGDNDRLSYLLELAGFTQGGKARDSEGRVTNPFPGARLPLRTLEGDPSRIIMPYVDGHSAATVSADEKWLTLTDEAQGPVRGALNIHPQGGHESGIVKDSRPRCARCKALLGAARGVGVTTVYDTLLWCDACATAHSVTACDAPGQRFAPDAVVRCAGSGRFYRDGSANLVRVVVGGARVLWSRDWAESHGYESPRGRWHAGERPAHVPPIPTALASATAVGVGDLVRFMPGEDSSVAQRCGYDSGRTYTVQGIEGGLVKLQRPESAPFEISGLFYPYRFYRVDAATGNARQRVAA